MIRRLAANAVAVGLVACGQVATAPLVASDIELSAARPGVPMRAAYLRLENPGTDAVRITSVSSPEFGKVELHETVMENDVARMRPVGELVVPPGDEVRLERGGMHLMLMRPVPAADRGDAVTLEFHDGERLVLSVVVRDPGN